MSIDHAEGCRKLLACAAIIVCVSASVLAQDSVDEARSRRDYEARLASTQALFSALERESSQSGVALVLEKAKGQIDQAGQQARARDFVDASRLLKEAIGELKVHLVQIKSKSGVDRSDAGTAVSNTPGALEQARLKSELSTARALLDALRRDSKVSTSDIATMEADVSTSSVLLADGKTAEAAILLDGAYASAKAMLAKVKDSPRAASGDASAEATRLAMASTLDSNELRQSYARRDASVRSLQAAFERVAKEKNVSQSVLTDTRKLQSEATFAADAGQYPMAIAKLDQAYLFVKTALAGLRGGSELIASKSFETPEQEFQYEMARNDDYAQLIRGLLDRSPERSDWIGLQLHSKRLRDTADQDARAHEWKDALLRINESTGDLKKILRAAGFPIL